MSNELLKHIEAKTVETYEKLKLFSEFNSYKALKINYAKHKLGDKWSENLITLMPLIREIDFNNQEAVIYKQGFEDALIFSRKELEKLVGTYENSNR